MNENYPCKCGHSQSKHINSAKACYGCLGEYIEGNSIHVCINFVLDNLSYLEQKYDQQILDKYRSIKEI